MFSSVVGNPSALKIHRCAAWKLLDVCATYLGDGLLLSAADNAADAGWARRLRRDGGLFVQPQKQSSICPQDNLEIGLSSARLHTNVQKRCGDGFRDEGIKAYLEAH